MSQSKPQYPKNIDDFKRVTGEFQATEQFRVPLLFAIGGRVFTGGGTLASVRYPVVNGTNKNLGTAAVLMKVLGIQPEGVQNVSLSRDNIQEVWKYFEPFKNDGTKHLNIEVLNKAFPLCGLLPGDEASSHIVASFIFDDIEPQGVEDSTLKLYGLSNRHFKPNQLNLTKIFTKLPNVAWHGDVPMDEGEVEQALMSAAFGDVLYAPHMIDKFPLYVHRIDALKMGVRITDQHKVRLGAYLGEGTALMPGASYMNYNSGTEGPCINEGRVSSSVWVGAGSDIGGGASTLGVLSGGNKVPISIGRNCLLEVNCALGIPIGDAVIIAAETAVMASTNVMVRVEGHPKFGTVVKARELAGINAVTFRRNDTGGEMEVVRVARNLEFAKLLAGGETILNADLIQNS